MSDDLLGPLVKMKMTKQDGTVITDQFPAIFASLLLLSGEHGYSSIIIEEIENDKYGIVQSMTEWIRSI